MRRCGVNKFTVVVSAVWLCLALGFYLSFRPYQGQVCPDEFFVTNGSARVIEGLKLLLPQNEYWQSLAIRADRMEADNSCIGSLQTGLSWIVITDNLAIELDSSVVMPGSDLVGKDGIISDNSAMVSSVFFPDRHSEGCWLNCFEFPVDAVSELQVRGFSLKLTDSNSRLRSIGASRAAGSAYKREFEFSGRVIIENNEGDYLRCSRCRWNFRDNSFTVTGRYILERAGREVSGQGGSFNYELDRIEKGNMKLSSF